MENPGAFYLKSVPYQEEPLPTEKKIEECDVLLIQRSSTDYYPPVINQARLLSKAGLKVTLIDGGLGRHLAGLGSDVLVLRPFSNLISASLAGRVWKNIEFIQFVRRYQKAAKVRICIAYDSPAILACLPSAGFSGMSVYHFHDHAQIGLANLNGGLMQYLSALPKLSKADVVVVADSMRKKMICRQAHIDESKVLVVRNCPMLCEKLPQGELKAHLMKNNFRAAKIVFFQGAVSENYYASQIIRSMKDWPAETGMVFMGPLSDSYRNVLAKIAKNTSVSDRVCFLQPVSYDRLFRHTLDADVGIALQKQKTENFKFMTGACNKRYEYMACGVAQISSRGYGLDELIEGNHVGKCVDPENLSEISNAVSFIVSNPSAAGDMAEKARRLHLDKYHYEKEFLPVLERILSRCGKP